MPKKAVAASSAKTGAKTSGRATSPSTSRAITPAPKRELSSQQLADQILEDAGAGQETMDRNDYAIPRLTILQDLSPQVKKTEEGYIKGAEAGMIADILNEKLYPGDEGILVIPVSYRRAYIEWKPRKSGGGFVADHGSDGSILDKCTVNPETNQKNVMPNGNTISTTAEYFVFLIDENGNHSPYVLSMASAQLKKSRRWNTMINQLRVDSPQGGTINPAMFYRSYRLTTIPERNDKGSWFGWKIAGDKNTIELANGSDIYLAAREFRKAVTEGKVTAAAPAHETAPTESDDAPM